jgi:predicted ATP-dependent endonuclease of OLD family
MKASNNNILEFILSEKVILVEGDAEYILMETFFKKVTDKKPEDCKVHIISIGGTSFKRYLDIAKLLGIRTAVIRDNDGDYLENCVNNYSSYNAPNIEIFSDTDSCRHTFEVAFYYDNKELCEGLFHEGRKTLSVKDYMLKNKADVAFTILDKKAEFVQPPQYIRDAIEWIRK